MDRALKVAAAFGIYDAVKKFTGHSDDLRAMSQSGWLSGAIVGAARPTCALAVKQFLDLVPLPGAVTLPAASKVSWSFPLAAPDAGTTSLTFGWDSGGPMLLVSLDGWKRSSGAVTVKLALGYAAGEVQCSTSFSAALKTSLGLPVTPRLSIGYTGASFNVSFFPLAADAVDGPMRLDLAPSLALTKGPDFEASLFQSLLLPLVTSLLFEATKGEQAWIEVHGSRLFIKGHFRQRETHQKWCCRQDVIWQGVKKALLLRHSSRCLFTFPHCCLNKTQETNIEHDLAETHLELLSYACGL